MGAVDEGVAETALASVRVEFDHGEPNALGSSVSAPSQRGSRRVAAFGGVLAVGIVGALIGLGRPSLEAAPPATTALPQPASTVSGQVLVERLTADIDPVTITSISAVGDEWIAATRDPQNLLWSNDDGLTWATLDAPGQPSAVLAVGSTADGQPLVLVNRSADGSTNYLETQVLRDGSWIVDRERPPMAEIAGRIRQTMLGEDAIVLIEDPWDRPVPEVSDALADFVPRDVAAQTCEVVRMINDEAAEYELRSCDDRIIGRIDRSLIDIGSESDDRLAFAQEVLRRRNIVYVARPGEPLAKIEMGPSQLVLSMAPTPDGFMAFILDTVDVLDDANLLYSQALAARLVQWDRETESFEAVETPILTSAWVGNRIEGNTDGSITLVTSLGLYRAEAPFRDWELLTTGPGGRLSPGQVFSSALYGDGFFVDDTSNDLLFWATCCGESASLARGWQDIQLEESGFRRVLIATDSTLLSYTRDGRTVLANR